MTPSERYADLRAVAPRAGVESLVTRALTELDHVTAERDSLRIALMLTWTEAARSR